MSLRSDLIAYLEALLPTVVGLEDVRIIPTVRAVDEIKSPILIVKTNTREPLPQAPRRSVLGDFTLTIVSPHTDIERAEDDLEARLELLEPSLTTWGMIWKSSTQVQYDEQRIAYDISITSIFTRTE